MDSSLPNDSGPLVPDFTARPESLSELAQTARQMRAVTDLNQLERMLLAVAVHPDGPGFDRAQLLLWDPRRERLCTWRTAQSSHGEIGLPAAVDRARPTHGDGRDAQGRFGGHAIAPSMLEACARGAWERMEIAVGPGAEAATPWRPGVQVGAVPLRRDSVAYALLLGEWDVECDPGARLASLQSWTALADDAIVACEQAERGRRLAHQSAALAQMARASVAPGNLAELLHLLASVAANATGARGSAVWLAPGSNATTPAAGAPALRLEVTYGPSTRRERLGRALQPMASAVMTAMKPRNIEQATSEMLLSPDAAAVLNTCAVVPLVAYGRAQGAFAVYDRIRTHPAESAAFDAGQVEFMVALADLVALAIDHARRFDELKQAEQRGREQDARMRRLERLAAFGEVAARAAHEARNPIASIRGFARRAAEGLSAEDPRHEYLEIVLRETDRIEKLLAEELESAVVEPPALALGSLNDSVQEALQRAGETLVRRRVRMLKKLSPELPPLLLDRERIRHAVGRILAGALDAVAIGGRVRVETRRTAQHAIVEIAHDGARAPGESLEQLFAPFATGRAGGSGLGLGIAQRIVQEHGGEVRVRAEGEWSTVVAFTLPVPGNQDRRHPGPDRRHGGHDRRKRFAGS